MEGQSARPTKTVAERVAEGSCIAELVLVSTEEEEKRTTMTAGGERGRSAAATTTVTTPATAMTAMPMFLHRFVLDPAMRQRQPPQQSFLDGKISIGDYVVLSTSTGHAAVTGGVVQELQATEIVVRTERPLPTAEHHARWVRPTKKSQHNDEADRMDMDVEDLHLRPIRWIIDTEELSSSFSAMRGGLVRLLMDCNEHMQRLRQLVVDLDAPRFRSHDTDEPPLFVIPSTFHFHLSHISHGTFTQELPRL
jgi:hypothetical protein